MRTALLTALLVLVYTFNAAAQFAIVDQMGQPFLTKNYTDVQGSAYLYDKWMKGSMTTTSGVTFDGVELMYDQVADELVFKGEKGEAKTSTQPLVEFTIKANQKELLLQERVFRRGFVPVDGANPNTFYEVLADGETQLLKRVSKRIFEELPYGSATKTKAFKTDVYYYIAHNEKLTKIRNDKKSVLQALHNKEAEIAAYIKANKPDLKNDAHLAKLILYYNTL